MGTAIAASVWRERRAALVTRRKRELVGAGR
jgi:hypothetical protein